MSADEDGRCGVSDDERSMDDATRRRMKRERAKWLCTSIAQSMFRPRYREHEWMDQKENNVQRLTTPRSAHSLSMTAIRSFMEENGSVKLHRARQWSARSSCCFDAAVSHPAAL
jgi:hypothetical protein